MQMFQARKILERLQDNSDIVSLINAKGGILSILDDEAWFTCLDCRDAYWTWTIDWNDHCDKKVSWRRLWSPRPRTRLLYQKSSKAMGTMPGQAANLPRFFSFMEAFFSGKCFHGRIIKSKMGGWEFQYLSNQSHNWHELKWLRCGEVWN